MAPKHVAIKSERRGLLFANGRSWVNGKKGFSMGTVKDDDLAEFLTTMEFIHAAGVLGDMFTSARDRSITPVNGAPDGCRPRRRADARSGRG